MIEALCEFLLEIVFVKVFYYPGRFFLRTLTLGRYPPPKDIPHHEAFVALAGLAIPLVLLTFTYQSR